MIDDEFEIREMASLLLAGLFGVTLRKDAFDIVADFERLDEPVVVLDISMPKLNGLSAARILKGRYPQARIVFFSGDSSPAKIEEAAALGGCSYVAKKFAVADLLPAVRAAAADPSRSTPARPQ